tara:strand:- start:2226 stop:2774 length:549 start_codon:yes stop_codon:yes gene_type:complete
MYFSELSFVLLFLTLALAAIIIIPHFYGAPWYPASLKAIRRALELCEPRPGETLYDLGCGDGRVLLLGAKEFGLKGVGVEIDPIKSRLALWRIKKAGMTNSILITRQNAINCDVRSADIIFVYLTHQALDRLLPILKTQMRLGARLVSYRYCLQGEVPDKVGGGNSIFLYRFNKGTKLNIFS